MKITKPKFHRFDTPSKLHEALALRVADDLHEAIENKGYATLMLSGGNTPKPFLLQLSNEPILWEKVRIGLVDERWVEPSSGLSNEQLVRTHLLQGAAKQATFYAMYDRKLSIAKACNDYNSVIQARLFPFDVVVLGMGDDGHTASLFPKRPELATLLQTKSDKLCGVAEAPVDPKERLSLSLAAIASASHCYLHIEGEKKLKVYEEALSGDDLQAMPVRSAIIGCGSHFETYFS